MSQGIQFDWSAFLNARHVLFDGAALTITFTVLTMLLSVPLAVVIAFLRLSRFGVVRKASTAWVEIFRSTPLLLQLYWVYYILPSTFDIRLPGFGTALVCFVLNVSAFTSETFRAGIVSIRREQTQAGLALGMSEWQVTRRVVLPQATRRVIPPLASTWVALFQDTSLVSFIGVSDMAFNALSLSSRTFQSLEVLSALALGYLLLGFPQAKLADYVYKRLRVRT